MSVLKRFQSLGLPLLMKELHEQSARSRTFVLRVVYAVLLILAVGLFNSAELFDLGSKGVSANPTLGLGKQFFQSILWMQFVGVYLFLPAIVCGVLTVEKERNTLGLLLITKLDPWTIILEKFTSRVVPMLLFLLISLPMISFTYALGGLEPVSLFFGLWFLLLTVLQIASLAVLASSFCGGTVGSFLGTYLLIFVLYCGPAIADFMILNGFMTHLARFGAVKIGPWFFGSNSGMEYILQSFATGAFAPPVMLQFVNLANGTVFGPAGASTLEHPFLLGVLCGIPTLMTICVSLALARFFLIRRAFVSSINPILSLFKWLDRIFFEANQKFAQGVILVKESHRLPDLEPVAWRETAKRSLGQFRYLVRVFVTLQLPTLLLVIMAAEGHHGSAASSEPVSALMFLLWIISIVLIAVTSSSLIAGERSRQTLDVLLATPLTGRNLILQKLRGVQRLMFVCAIPLLTCIGFQTWWRPQLSPMIPPSSLEDGSSVLYQSNSLEYLVTCLANVVILFHLTMWSALWISMKMKSPSKAILTTLGVLVGWCILPFMLTYAGLMAVSFDTSTEMTIARSGAMLWFLDSPAYLVVYLEFQSLRLMTLTPFLPLVLNSLIYGGCWLLIRHYVLTHADESLSRTGEYRKQQRLTGWHWQRLRTSE